MSRCLIPLSLVLLVLAGRSVSAAQYYPPTVSQAIASYMRDRQAAIDEVNRKSEVPDAVNLTAKTDELAKAVISRRQESPEGSVFDKATAAVIRTRLGSLFSLKDRPQFLHLVVSAPDSAAIAANTRYPDQQPPSTLPAALLVALPAVPPELEYRFVGRDLILLDRQTSVVIDVVRDALPLSGSSRGQ